MTAPPEYIICLQPDGTAFGAIQTAATAPEDGERRPLDVVDCAPERCVHRLVAAGHLPETAHLGRWHKTADVDVAGYWSVDTG